MRATYHLVLTLLLPLTHSELAAAELPLTSGTAGRGVEADPCDAQAAALRVRIAELEAELAAIRTEPVAVGAAEVLEQPGTRAFYQHAFMALCCVLLAALAAGLTMGLVSIEPMEMKIIVNTEDKDMLAEKDKIKLKDDQDAARRVLPLIHDHHRLLVTLLLMNSLANEALPLFLDKIVPSWLAVILSVSLVLIFGEILPSAVFTGSEQLRIAAMFAPLVACCKFFLAPIAVPLAKVLDIFLGEDHKGRYNFAEVRAIVGIHADLRNEAVQAAIFKQHDDKQLGIISTSKPHHFTDETVVVFTDAPGHPAKSTKLRADGTFYFVQPCDPLVGRDPACTFKLYSSEARDVADLITFSKGELESGAFAVQERDEIKIMHGVMKLTHMTAKDKVTTLSEVDMLEASQDLTRRTMDSILGLGHSRLPVYREDKHNVRGFMLAKTMIVVSPDDGNKVEDLDINPLVLVDPEIPMLDLLNKFQADRCHIALVTSDPEAVRTAWKNDSVIPPDVHMMGIITLEDIIELLIQEDIYDEHDQREGLPLPERQSSRRLALPVAKKTSVTHASSEVPRPRQLGNGNALQEPLLLHESP